jgi:iron(III) transport system substrate-binding protein
MHALWLVLFLLVSFGISHAQPKETPQSEWENVQKAARKEGRIVIWGPPGAEARQGLSAGFQKTFPGIEVEYSGAPGSKVAPRLVAERQAGVSTALLLSWARFGHAFFRTPPR